MKDILIFFLIASFPFTLFFTFFGKNYFLVRRFGLLKRFEDAKQEKRPFLERSAIHELGHITSFKILREFVGKENFKDLEAVCSQSNKVTDLLEAHFYFDCHKETKLPLYELAMLLTSGYVAERFFCKKDWRSLFTALGCASDIRMLIKACNGNELVAREIWRHASADAKRLIGMNNKLFLKSVGMFYENGRLSEKQISNYVDKVYFMKPMFCPAVAKDKFYTIGSRHDSPR